MNPMFKYEKGEDDQYVEEAPEYGDVDGCGKCGAPWVAAEGAEAKPIGIKAKDGSEMMMVPTHFCSKDCGNWMRRGGGSPTAFGKGERMSEALKPCPFCGEAENFCISKTVSNGVDLFKVEHWCCDDRGVMRRLIHVFGESPDHAIELWNGRVQEKQE